MADELQTLRARLDDVARRRRALVWRRALGTGAAVAAVVLTATAVLIRLVALSDLPLVAVVLTALAAAVALLVVAVRAVGPAATRLQIARLVEERSGGLDDVVVTAVDYGARADQTLAVADRLASAALRVVPESIGETVVERAALTGTTRRLAAALVGLAVALGLFVRPLTDATVVATAYLLPSRLELVVEPGNVRVAAGRTVTIRARLRGAAAALTPTLQAGDAAAPTAQMTRAADGSFVVTLEDLSESFPYRVVAGARRSPEYTVTVVHPPRVQRIDLDYVYPKALGLQPRREEDGGDIYAPSGTDVTLTVTLDRPVGAGALMMADGSRVPLGVRGASVSGRLTVASDGSYRIAVMDDGVETPDQTEYFIRTLLDRPPDVRVLRPGGDKQVTALEEVLIEARADDDFGISSLELVLQKPGGPEVVVPLTGTRSGLTANGEHLLALEDLEVAPGDFVTYFARARDIGRGKPSSESRTDMYFLEVKAFNDEFVAAQSQALAAGAQSQNVQDLAAAQKEIVVATWKLDSRGRRARNGQSAADIKALADAQRALEQRAAKEAGNQLQTSVTEPRRRRGQATLNGVSDDPMGLAIEAMRRAAVELDKLQTSAAMPHELEALNQLLRAESDVKRRQVARQQGGGGGGSERNTPDLSALFDQELRKQQETNYETPASAETRQDERPEDDRLAKLRELARRQEALGREQQDLAANRDSAKPEELQRRLERLSREQEQLRRELERLADRMPNERRPNADGQQSSARRDQSEQGRPQGQQPGQQQGQQAQGQPQSSGQQPGSSGASTSSGQRQTGAGEMSDGERLRDAAEQMRRATAGLQQQDPAAASDSAGRALERLQQAERSFSGATPDGRRRRLGDLQLEARQLADAERRASRDLDRAAETPAGSDARRQAAAEQERLASRADRLEQQLRGLGAQARDGAERTALGQAIQELDKARVDERMREAARGVRAGTSPEGRATSQGTRAGAPRQQPSNGAEAAEIARSLDRVAERLDAARAGDVDEARRLSDALARSREIREQLESVERTLERLNAEGRSQESGARGDRSQSERGASGAPRGRQGEGAQAGNAAEIARLQRDVAEQMRATRERVDALSRANPGMFGPNTPEGWQPSVSAPGTEAFKQDFARWDSLKQNLLLSLERVERTLSSDLRSEAAKDRLNAGAADSVPEEYRALVEKYYRSLAAPRRQER